MATTLNETYNPLPSPPLSPHTKCNNNLEVKPFVCSDEELKDYNTILGSPSLYSIELSKDDILRNQYLNRIEEGVLINEEMTPYNYVIQSLHNIGMNVINKKTKDSLPLRVYEIEKDIYEEYWVHPIFLSLQSFQFFKLFEEVKNNNEQGTIEIEVPSLQTFKYIIYWLYTGDLTKLLEIARLNESFCKGIIDNIKYLEIDIPIF